jgi:hypothetical protein
MAISRRDLMEEVLPMLNETFDEAYSQHHLLNFNRIEMPRRGRYQVWQGQKMVADKIKHRREALAMMKLLMENDDGNS